jgi:Fe-Mn family superoxide dismutase
MPDMYETFMPMRVLEEIRSWKRQEREQTMSIRKQMTYLQPEYREQLEQWEAVLGQTEAAAEQWMDAIWRSTPDSSLAIRQSVYELLQVSSAQSRQMLQTLHAILGNESRSRNFERPSPEASPPATGEGNWSASTVPYREVPIGGHTLPPLPYNYNALEPHIDEKTMRIHHDIHHKSYVDGLNTAEKKMAEARQTGNYDLVKHWERELAFNGAGHYLHTIFWNAMSPKGGGQPKGDLARQIERDFGSFEAFKQQFSAAAEKVEGGGWAILVWSPRSGRLEILQAEKHQNLSQWDVIPLLPLDVWEHAYYLKYQNKRPDYVKAWWNVVNWPYVAERFGAASQLKWQPY